MSVQDRMKRVPVAEQDPEVRAKNFDEVCLGYLDEEAVKEANRCVRILNVLKDVLYLLIFQVLLDI